MRLLSITLVLLFVSGTLSGCISEEETERRFIDDDSELLDAEDAGVCGDLDGDGEMDCPLSGYIPDTMPWWCNSTGIGGHHVDPAYEGMEKGELSGEECEALTAEFQAALEWSSQWATLGEAEAAGFHMLVGYTEGMGTHHARLGDFRMDSEDFDASSPEFTGTSLDEAFDYSQPEFLMFAGEESDSELVGFAWFVRSPSDIPPEGFTGDNDWWHRHESLCFQMELMLVRGEDLSEEQCEGNDGENVMLGEYWMAHAWIVRPWLTNGDVFTNHHPCLPDEGAIYDDEHECWDDTSGHVGHDI
tara:strand:+ start:10898 stop:11803 length:906 start_codon:yes stop_codon:yes gene_type:complete